MKKSALSTTKSGAKQKPFTESSKREARRLAKERLQQAKKDEERGRARGGRGAKAFQEEDMSANTRPMTKASLSNPGDYFDKATRAAVWRAIRNDDPAKLFALIDCPERIAQATTGLWNPNKRTGIRSKSLLDVLATQQHGAPPDGPMRCLQTLLARFPHAYTDKEELRSAIRHANNCSRPHAAQCIERHLADDS